MPTCSTCQHWNGKSVVVNESGIATARECRRFPPNYSHAGRWPTTMAEENCGEHKPVEE